MATNKNAFARYLLIDEYLQKPNGVTTRFLAEKCVQQLGLKDLTVEAIQKDLNALQYDPILGFYAKIVHDKSRKVYYYENGYKGILSSRDALVRYKIIDRYLKESKGVTIKFLATKCAQQLGLDQVTAKLILKDLQDLQEDTRLEFYAKIEHDEVRDLYYYAEGYKGIFPSIGLKEEEINALIFYGRVVN